MGGRGGALPDFFFFSLFPVQQTTSSGIGHRVKSFFGLATNTTLNMRNMVINLSIQYNNGGSLPLYC